MSLLVAGIVSHARVDTQMTQLHIARAKVVAAGDGAIQLAMANEMLANEALDNGAPPPGGGQFRLGDVNVRIELLPSEGLVDPNSATEEQLAALFERLGALPPGEAQSLANNVITWRGSAAPGGSRTRQLNKFIVIEDLLRIDGLTRTVFDSIKDFLAIQRGGGSGIDWALAPPELLSVLEATAPDELNATMRAREEALVAQANGGASRVGRSSRMLRADAIVEYGQRSWLRRRWIVLGSSPNSSLPWRVVRTEPARVRNTFVGRD